MKSKSTHYAAKWSLKCYVIILLLLLLMILILLMCKQHFNIVADGGGCNLTNFIHCWVVYSVNINHIIRNNNMNYIVIKYKKTKFYLFPYLSKYTWLHSTTGRMSVEQIIHML